MPSPPAISVVVPLYNEAGNVLPLANRIFAALGEDPRGIELILIDDCSSDETWTRIIEARQKDTRVRGLRHGTNRGQSAALWTGFKASRGSIIATLDGDLQNDPADFPGMLSQLGACDMVCGMRTKRADNLVRRISTKIARWARRLALRTNFVDTGCNLRVFKRSVLETLPAFDGIHRFMPILAQNGGAVVREVHVQHHPRASGVSKYGVWNRLGRGIRDLVMVGLFLRRQLKTLDSSTSEHESPAEPVHEQSKRAVPQTSVAGSGPRVEMP
jgi:dolichol-phosphate mannosyltransferase